MRLAEVNGPGSNGRGRSPACDWRADSEGVRAELVSEDGGSCVIAAPAYARQRGTGEN